MKTYDMLISLGPVAWKQILTQWERDEDNEEWKAIQRERGFSTWRSWREFYTNPYGCEKLSWKIFDIPTPEIIVPRFYGGPFKSWIDKHYQERALVRFRDFVTNGSLDDNDKVRSLIRSFPKDTRLVGLISDKEIIVLEGMHRCSAVALAAKNNKAPIAKRVTIALAEYNKSSFPVPRSDGWVVRIKK